MGSDADDTKPSPYLDANVRLVALLGVDSPPAEAEEAIGSMAGDGTEVTTGEEATGADGGAGRSHVVSPVV